MTAQLIGDDIQPLVVDNGSGMLKGVCVGVRCVLLMSFFVRARVVTDAFCKLKAGQRTRQRDAKINKYGTYAKSKICRERVQHHFMRNVLGEEKLSTTGTSNNLCRAHTGNSKQT